MADCEAAPTSSAVI